MKLILATVLATASFSSFASSTETSAFIDRIKNRDCEVILDILLDRTVEANRLGLAAFTRLQQDENDKIGNSLLSLSNKQFELSDATKVLLTDKCFQK